MSIHPFHKSDASKLQQDISGKKINFTARYRGNNSQGIDSKTKARKYQPLRERKLINTKVYQDQTSREGELMNTKIRQDRQYQEGTLINKPFRKVRKSEGTHKNTMFHMVQTSEVTHSNTTVRKVQTQCEGAHNNTTHICQYRIPKSKRVPDTKSNLLIRLEAILSAPPIPIAAPSFQFELSDSAYIINFGVLQKSYFDLHKVLMDHPLEPTSIGSELRRIDQLKKILGNHPNWKRIQDTISDGTDYHTKPIKDKT